MAGEAAAAFCATRPPGHHARREATSGFCLFNNVAVAARHALDALGARRVFKRQPERAAVEGRSEAARAALLLVVEAVA